MVEHNFLHLKEMYFIKLIPFTMWCHTLWYYISLLEKYYLHGMVNVWAINRHKDTQHKR